MAFLFSVHGTKRRTVRCQAEASKRVVVTGMGVVSPLGHTPEEFHENLVSGVSGVKSLEELFPGDFDDFPTRIAAKITDFKAGEYLDPKKARRLDPVHAYAIVAAKKALKQAGLYADDLKDFDLTRFGVIVGSAMGGMKFLEDNISTLGNRGVKRVSPFTIPYYLSNMSAGMIAMEPELGFRGPNYSINTACATSNYCFINAAEHIRSGQSDVIIAGGAEAPITAMGMAGFIACKALSSRNDEPQRASRPWDKQRDGFVMGEGAGILVLESLDHAKDRGATIYAEYLGGGVSCDAYDLTSPRTDGRDVILCMKSALDDAGITADKVDLVNAHGTSTPVGDLCEVSAINSVFGEYKDHVKIHSTKSMTGHSLGAAGALEGIAMLMAIQTGQVHPTINHEEPEEGVEFNVVPNEAINMDVKVGLSNSFGFGGHNSSVIFGQYKE
ncbi:hypothetical protein NDN08_005417 [Rhodosorus marinus]|uniref:3-oxoacyl-[acyl-carrier-protein] synthase n=1 Tax=Rhodosorus marinus TaxID=101924 RepID=A0AAV8V4R5_9RHOD|nr:hypothetical protein NDN08_005417 [Rhodosorus marinus]